MLAPRPTLAACPDLLAGSESSTDAHLRRTAEWLDGFSALAAPDHAGHHGEQAGPHDDHFPDHDLHDHAAGVRSLTLVLSERLDWAAFAVWLTALLHRHGRNILRVKGILDVDDIDGPVMLQAVQHFLHPPVHLPAWPDADRGSKLVFIVKNIDPARIEESLTAFLAAAARLGGAGGSGDIGDGNADRRVPAA